METNEEQYTIDTTPFRVKIDEPAPGPNGHPLRKWNALKLNIDRHKTAWDEDGAGVYPEELSHGSVRKVWAVCIQCGKGRWATYQKYHHLCIQCSQSGKSHSMFGKHHSEESRIKTSCTMQGIPVEEFPGFIMYGKYCSKFNEALKERIREKYGRKCLLCSMTEDENIKKYGRKLPVHHVDYNKQCGCDGNECRLVPLCSKCHPKTNGNRSRWEQLIMQKVVELFPDINFDSPQTSIADFYIITDEPRAPPINHNTQTTLF